MSARSEDDQPIRDCPRCHAAASGRFCGDCGADLDAIDPSWLQGVLRPRVFTSASRERVGWPLITTTLFPRLSEPFRLPFRHALFLVLAMLLLFSMTRSLGPLVIVTAMGVSLLFGVYVWESGAAREISPWALAIVVVLGVGINVAWWWWSTNQVARAYGVPLATGAQLTSALGVGLVITLVGAVLMVLPAVAVRLLRIPVRECLDGFVIGALGALVSSTAATITWFAPQFIAGLIDHYGPRRLFEEAFLYGLVDPLTAAAAGGLVGLALWFRPRSGSTKLPRLTLAALAVAGIGLYMAVYVVDAADLSRAMEVAVNTVVTMLAMVTVRIGIQVALLYGEPDVVGSQPVQCGQCQRIVRDAAFCGRCGAARQASAISARFGSAA